MEAMSAYIDDHFLSADCHANALCIAASDSCKSTAPIFPSVHTPGEDVYSMGLFFRSYAIVSLMRSIASSMASLGQSPL